MKGIKTGPTPAQPIGTRRKPVKFPSTPVVEKTEKQETEKGGSSWPTRLLAVLVLGLLAGLMCLLIFAGAYVFGDDIVAWVNPEPASDLADNVQGGATSKESAGPVGDPGIQPTPHPVDENYAGGYGVDDPHDVIGGENPPISVSGGYQITGKTEIWVYPDGWSRLVKAENGAGTSWSNLWKINQADSGVTYYWPHPWELRVEGTGVFQITLTPDNTEGGYNSSDLHGLGLAFWVSGDDGQIQVSRDGGSTWLAPTPYELTTGSAGIDFPLDGGTVTIRVTLNDGIMYLPLGESVPTGDLPLWQ